MFSGLNMWIVVAAAVASFVFGGVWYGMLSRQWMAAAGIEEAFVKGEGGGPAAMPFVIAFVAQLIMAWMLAGVVLHLTRSGLAPSVRNGVVSGFFIWFGFVMTSLVVNHAFQGAKRSLTLIDGGHWLGVLLIQGAIVGWGGIR